jgi:hypothetical protein
VAGQGQKAAGSHDIEMKKSAPLLVRIFSL